MKKEHLINTLCVLGTALLTIVICWNLWGKKQTKIITIDKGITAEDSTLIIHEYEYNKLLKEQIDLYGELRTYEDNQLKAKTTYRTYRDTILRIDTITKVDVIKLVNSCNSVIEKDSLIITNYEQQIEVKDKMINNLNESKDIFESRVKTLQQNEVELVKQNEKLKTKNKRRLKTALISTGVAVGSVLLLFL